MMRDILDGFLCRKSFLIRSSKKYQICYFVNKIKIERSVFSFATILKYDFSPPQ